MRRILFALRFLKMFNLRKVEIELPAPETFETIVIRVIGDHVNNLERSRSLVAEYRYPNGTVGYAHYLADVD
jgi:hypothetical protein